MRTSFISSSGFRASVLVIMVVGLLASCGQKEAVMVFQTKYGAIDGYDPVAYFTDEMPLKGKAEYVHEWNGANWYFSSPENLESFKEYPEKFVPQFGGYCAYGTAEGHKAPTSPDAWTIVDGKLYLNYNTDVMKEWRSDQSNLIEKANENWPEVMKMKE